MGEVITITSGKGGVGKTTTTGNIGTALALLGKSVVLIDADIGLRNLDVILGLENRIVFDIVDVVEKRCKLRSALIKDKRVSKLFLLPAAQTRDKDAVSPEQMRELCDQLRQDFDYVIIDSPAGIEQGFKNAIAGADKVIIVTTPEVAAVRDADRIIGIVEAHGLHDPTLLINRLRPELVARGDMLTIEDVKEVLAIGLIGVIPEDDNIVVATNKGEPIVLVDASFAGQAYRNIARRILGETIPLLDMDNGKGLLSRLKRMLGM